MPRKPRRQNLIDEIERAAETANVLRRQARGKNIFHVAELYGVDVCQGLRPWAKRAVLSRFQP